VYLLVMVLDDAQRLDDVLRAWMQAGVPGITILESTGIHRVLTRHRAQPAYMGFGQMFGSGRVGHNTLLAVIDAMETAEAAVAATEEVVGTLDRPDTGLVFVVPIARTWGVPQPYGSE